MPNTVTSNINYPIIERSQALYRRASELIPSCTQTLAKGPSQHVQGVAPVYLERGKGCHVWDVDGNEYLDMTMGVGPLCLGYGDPDVDQAIRNQLSDGITFSLMHPLEVEVAEMLHRILPNAEMIRYSKTGADTTSAAVRLARAHTGKSKVLCCGYHGWHDWYISVTARNGGIPSEIQALSHTFTYNDINSVANSIDDDTACVILEPVVFEEPKHHFLQELRKLCTARNVVLIFDEMWTGFRIALGGAQARYDVVADLSTYSKAVANGMPIAVLAGRADIMRRLDADVFFYTTFGGEALSLAATKATITKLQALNVPETLDARGTRFRDRLNAILKEHQIDGSACVGLPCRTMLTFSAALADPLLQKSFVQQELIKRGVLWSGFHNLSYAHTDQELDYLLSAYREVIPLWASALKKEGDLAARLRGKPVEPVFRKTGDFNTKPKQ